MDDFHALETALAKMELEEGQVARNSLVWSTLRDNIDDTSMAMARRLSEHLKNEQGGRGVRSPVCGELMSAEILFKLWLLTKGDD